MKCLKIIFIFFLLETSSRSEVYPSLFFTQEDLSKKMTEKSPFLQKISLQGILYISASNWSLWVNGHLIQAHTPSEIQNLQIEKVTPESATFLWESLEDGTGERFHLYPQQTYRLQKRKVEY